VERRSEVAILHFLETTGDDGLSVVTDSSEAHKKGFFVVSQVSFAAFSLRLDDLKELVGSFAHAHELWRHVLAFLLHQRLQRRFLDLDVEQAKRVEAVLAVCVDFVVEAVWLPRFRPVGNRNCFTEVIELKTRAADSVHDRGIVDDLHFDSLFFSSEDQVSVSCSTEGITDNEESDV
jgi:hypothetical protein